MSIISIILKMSAVLQISMMVQANANAIIHRLDIGEIFATGIKCINESYNDFETKPTFDVTDSYISITLPIKKEIELTDNERLCLNL